MHRHCSLLPPTIALPLQTAPCDPDYRTDLTESGDLILKEATKEREPPASGARPVAGRSSDVPGPAVLPGAAASTPHAPWARPPAAAPTWPALLGSPAPSLHPPCPAPGPLGAALRAAGPEAAAARTRQPTGLGSGTRGAGPAHAGSGPGREEAPPPGSRGRPVTPPAPPPRGPAAKLASPAATPLLARETPGHLALPPRQCPTSAGPAPPPGVTTFPDVPPGAPPETMAHPSPGRPRFMSATTSPPPWAAGAMAAPFPRSVDRVWGGDRLEDRAKKPGGLRGRRGARDKSAPETGPDESPHSRAWPRRPRPLGLRDRGLRPRRPRRRLLGPPSKETKSRRPNRWSCSLRGGRRGDFTLERGAGAGKGEPAASGPSHGTGGGAGSGTRRCGAGSPGTGQRPGRARSGPDGRRAPGAPGPADRASAAGLAERARAAAQLHSPDRKKAAMSARSLAASSAPSPAPPPQPELTALAVAAGPEDAAGAAAPPLLPLMAAAAPAAAPGSGPAPLAPRAARSAPGLAAPSAQLPAPGAWTQSPGAAAGGGDGGGSAGGARPHRRGLRPRAASRPRGGGAEPRPRRRRPERGQQRAPCRTRSREGGGPWPAGAPGSRAPAAAASLHLDFKWGRKEGEGGNHGRGNPGERKRESRERREEGKKKKGLRQFPANIVRGRSVGSAGGRGLWWAGPGGRGGAAPGCRSPREPADACGSVQSCSFSPAAATLGRSRSALTSEGGPFQAQHCAPRRALARAARGRPRGA